jgi:colanic acid/amylovoran biosynthesis glycosyltransferase
MYRRLFATADAVTVNSDYTRRGVEKLGCPPAKLHQLSVGLDPKEFPFRERSVQAVEPVGILTVGRLVEIKGHEFVIRAVAKVREQHAEVRYDIVGDGPLRPKLEKLIAQLGLDGVVTLHGAREGAEVKRLMAGAHLFVLASVSVEGDQEGQGLALQEAQACGLPVLATQHGAFPEGILAGKSGFLVPERDVEALADRLGYLIEHPETWAAMGRQGRAFVERRYDMRQLNQDLLAIYARAIETFQRSKR